MELEVITQSVLFYLFGGLAIATALLVILFRNPIYSAISLVVTFFSVSVLYLLLQSEFIAVMQILVYAGAVMVLVIFVIMLLNLRSEEKKLRPSNLIRSSAAFVLVSLMLATFVSIVSGGMAVLSGHATVGTHSEDMVKAGGVIQHFSKLLFSEYLIPFELTSFLLTVAIVGVVVLAKGMKLQETTEQEGQK